MAEQSLCIKVKKIHGERALVLAKKLGISNRKLRIQQNLDSICIPLIRNPDEAEIAELKAQLSNFELQTQFFLKKRLQRKTINEILEDQLPPHLLAVLPRAFDVIGDIAVINLPSELKTHRQAIGKAILKTHKNLKTVLAKISAVSGTYRLRELELIAGEKKTTTVYKEYGCQYQVDIATAYFSPRLSHEHNRVASLVQSGETVVDLFAGVGPFSVLIAKKHINSRVYAIDINPEAVQFLKKNIRLNRVDNQVIPILEDAREAVEDKLLGVADRVIMNLPKKAIEFVDIACRTLKSTGGIIHYYAFLRLPGSLQDTQLSFSKMVEKTGRKVDAFLSTKTVRETAPYESQIVVDAKII